MKQIALLALGLLATLGVEAQTYKFDFTTGKKTKDGYTKITPADRYSEERDTDMTDSPLRKVKVQLHSFLCYGSRWKLPCHSRDRKQTRCRRNNSARRITPPFLRKCEDKKGELKPCTFVINKRNTHISEKENVRIKPRERQKLNWDDKLTLEFNGDAPQLSELIIEKVNNVPTVFLCGNSTVVDQDNEPWASWGQMIPRFFNDSICFANYAESGESANTFIGAGRLKRH